MTTKQAYELGREAGRLIESVRYMVEEKKALDEAIREHDCGTPWGEGCETCAELSE